MPETEPTLLAEPQDDSAPGVNPVNDSPAISTLRSSCARAKSLLSIGLEPSERYLGGRFEPTIAGYESFLMAIVEAGAGRVGAFKFNLAFFEALGPEGWSLLFRVRERMPDGVYVIADAKRGDIGTTATHYAQAMYDQLRADAATINPLMGRDAVEPFLEYEDKLAFVLALTSNPGAADFLGQDKLAPRIAARCSQWNTRGNVGLVVGATRADSMRELRDIGPRLPWLVPGIGAQGGSLEDALGAGRSRGDWPGMLIHVSRGVLPRADDEGETSEIIVRRIDEWNHRINEAVAGGEP